MLNRFDPAAKTRRKQATIQAAEREAQQADAAENALAGVADDAPLPVAEAAEEPAEEAAFSAASRGGVEPAMAVARGNGGGGCSH